MKIEPLGDRVVIERTVASETSKGGIIIPQGAKEIPFEGVVKATGGEKKVVKVGDRVLFAGYAGTEIEVGGKKQLIMPEQDILAVIRE